MAWVRFAESTWHVFTSREWLVSQLTAFPLAAAALLIGLPRLREAARPAWHAGLLLALVALLYACVIAGTEHAKQNSYAYRYLIPSLLLLQSASAAVAVSPLGAVQHRARIARWLTPAGMLGLWAAAIVGFGLPSLTGVRQDIDRQLGQRTAELLAANCTYCRKLLGCLACHVPRQSRTARARRDARALGT